MSPTVLTPSTPGRRACGPRPIWMRPIGSSGVRGPKGCASPCGTAPLSAPRWSPFERYSRQLGYRARVRSITDVDRYYRAISDSGNEVQMAVSAWNADYSAASNFFATQLTCDSFVPNDPDQNLNWSGFCNPEIDAMIDRATRVQAKDSVAGRALWAEDRSGDRRPSPVRVARESNRPRVRLRPDRATTSGARSGGCCLISSGSGSCDGAVEHGWWKEGSRLAGG